VAGVIWVRRPQRGRVSGTALIATAFAAPNSTVTKPVTGNIGGNHQPRKINLQHLKPGSAPFTLLLSCILSLQLLGIAITLPALPSIAADYGVDSADAQLTISAFLAGIAASQLLYGTLSDRFGRKPVLLGGLALYGLTGLGCALAPSIGWLIGLRLLQGVAAAGGSVIARAMVRDLFSGREGVRMLSRFTIMNGAVPLLAPLAGGWLLILTGWRGVFAALSVASLASLAFAAALLAESIREKDHGATRLGQLFSNCRRFITTPGCLALASLIGLINGAQFGYSATSSFVLMKTFGVSSSNYGWFLAITAVAMMVGSWASGRLALRWSIRRSLTVAVSVNCASGLAVLAGTLIAAHTGQRGALGIALMIVPMLFYAFVLGMLFSNAIAGALHPLPDIAGLASGLVGSMQMIGAGFFVWLGGWLYDGTPATIGYIMAIGGCSGCTVFFLFARRHAPGRQA